MVETGEYYSVDSLSRSFSKLDKIRLNRAFSEFYEDFVKTLQEKSIRENWESTAEDWLEMMNINFDDSLLEWAFSKIQRKHIPEYIEIVIGTLSSTTAGYYWNYILYDTYILVKGISIEELLLIFNTMNSVETIMSSFIIGNTSDIPTPENFMRIANVYKDNKMYELFEIWILESEKFDNYFQWLPREIIETTIELYQ